jgi:imidazoleglycerol-phosphate dehydratase
LHGFNSHHIVEAAMKSVAARLRVAVETDPRKADAIRPPGCAIDNGIDRL